MNTPVLDHVIITENSYYSFKSSGLLDRLEASNKYVPPYELEKQFHEGMQEKIKRVGQESIEQIARKMLAKGYSEEEIQGITGINVQEIDQIVQDSNS